jgi:lipoprotein-anchoring transpeptidase ErfK/SrfK
VAALGCAAALAGCGGGEKIGPLDVAKVSADAMRGIAVADIPAPAVAGLAIGPPQRLGADPHAVRWAALQRPTIARTAPSPRGHHVARLSSRTPEGTTNLVVVLGSRRDASGRLWIRVRLPARGVLSAWVPRSALGTYGIVHTRLVVDRKRLTLTLLRDGQVIFRAPVGIGRPGTPTPGGLFYVRDRVTRYASAFYGPIAFGTSAQSPTLTDWPGGGFVGIHGTDRPDLVPGRISHGCVRLRNADIVQLARLMPVGTPLEIR